MTGSPPVDSAAVSTEVASGGLLRFYLRTLLTDPRKILVGAWESLLEVIRFVLWPRFPVRLNVVRRLALVSRFGRTEVAVPGGTTLLETLWLTYAAARATSQAPQWVEVGCFRGLSTARLSLLCAAWGRRLKVYDTFAGLPGSDEVYDAVDGGAAYHFRAGSYRGSEEEVRANVGAHGSIAHVELVPGDVSGTLRMHPPGKISFAFLDVDLVASYRSCFAGLAGSVESGTIIVIHEACYGPIRSLVEDRSYWLGLGMAAPTIEYVADRYGVVSCRNLALLSW
jgi:Macrocin-O-methyltransferase (TylF)